MAKRMIPMDDKNLDQFLDKLSDRISDRILVLVNFAERLKGVESQQARTASDIESEKRTRADSTRDLNERLREVEKSNWKAAGALALFLLVLQVAFQVFAKVVK